MTTVIKIFLAFFIFFIGYQTQPIYAGMPCLSGMMSTLSMPILKQVIEQQSGDEIIDVLQNPTKKTVSTAYYKLGKKKQIEFWDRIDTIFHIINNKELIASIRQMVNGKKVLIEENQYTKDGKIAQKFLYKKGILALEEEYTYNKNKDIINTKFRVDGVTIKQIDYSYDILNLCTQEIYKNQFGQQIKNKRLSYLPDKKIKEETVYANTSEKLILEQIKYVYKKNKLEEKIYLGKGLEMQKAEIYDKNEMLTEIIIYGMNDREIEKTKIVYDEKFSTIPVEKIIIGRNGKIIETVQTTLDNAIGRPIQVVVLDKNKIVLSQISFGYNKKNELIKEEHIKAGVIDYIKVYNRNAQGIVTEEILYNAQQQVIEKKIFSFSFAS